MIKELSTVYGPPDGQYQATSSGNEAVFMFGNMAFKAVFKLYVKGFNVPDTVTVKGKDIRSAILGGDGVLVVNGAKLEDMPSKYPDIPDGTYESRVSGYVETFTVKGVLYKAEFETGVRGRDIPSTVTATNGVLKSGNLSGEGKLL